MLSPEAKVTKMQNVSIPTTEPKATKHRRSASDSLILGSGVDQAAASNSVVMVEPHHQKRGVIGESDMDLRRIKRILSNRASARRARDKQAEYLHKLETAASKAQVQIALLRSQYADIVSKKMMLQTENMMMQERVNAVAQVIASKDAEIEALLGERAALHLLAHV